ncbi:acyl-CoA dehydrogenase [Sanguibacter sp. 25GB23B1]|uniref:acyl-CoA dehydrogenase family protein n=1 Tax=unclassified Sanguibacter TaxID=2645534 RepID=UPI0032AF8064
MTTLSDRTPAADSSPDDVPTASPAVPRPGEAHVDVARLGEHLLGRWAVQRAAGRRIGGDPAFARTDGLSMAEHRERVLSQLSLLAADGNVLRAFPESFGGQADAGGGSVVFEELIAADPSLKVKAGVQWGLFAATIYHLGTPEQQERWLPSAMDVSVPGAFAMTEIGHGSDVAAIGTTATYDAETEEFVIHTPFKAAWKDYLGNAGQHGTAATVFAQLITQGVNHGVHAFYVPIRATEPDGRAGAFLPGVGGEDDGLKGGLLGVDNGRLHFTHVRVPRRDLLGRYGQVAADGTYTSPIAHPGRRFFTMLGALVQGRVTLDGAAAVAAKLGLATAVRYGNERRQFADADGQGEVVLLDYREHQRRLLPLLARAYAGHYAHERLLDLLDTVFSGRVDTEESRSDLETTSAALKPVATWRALETLQTAREACGGAGFLAENRIVSLRADMDVFVTFEGDNTVLLQLVGKRLLASHAAGTFGADGVSAARIVVERAADSALYAEPDAEVARRALAAGAARDAGGDLAADATQRALLSDRVETMIAELADALHPTPHDVTGRLSRAEAAALFNDHQPAVVEAARAYADLLQWEAFTAALATVEDPGTRQVLTRVRDLFGLEVIEKDLAWYVLHERLSVPLAQALRKTVAAFLADLRPHAQDLVDAFGYGPEHVRATIATGVEKERQDEARAHYRALRESGLAPVSEKSLRPAPA